MDQELPFYIHYLHPGLKKYVNSILKKQDIQLPRTYSDHVYSYLAKRLKSVYDRTNQFQRSFIKMWSLATTPGYLVYAANKEQLRLYHDYKCSKLTIDILNNKVSNGHRVIYYGEQFFPGVEAYVTPARQKVEQNRLISELPLIGVVDTEVKHINPFNGTVVVYTIQNAAILAFAPKFVQALDTKVIGKPLFGLDGTILYSECNNTSRLVCVSCLANCYQIKNVSEVKNTDTLLLMHELMLSEEEASLQNQIFRYFKKNNIRTVSDGNLQRIDLRAKFKNFKLDTFIKVNTVLIFTDDEQRYKIYELLMISSFASSYGRLSLKIPELISATPIAPTNRFVSNALLSVSLQLRKSFIFGRDMGITVIAPKAGFKTTVMHLIRDACPEYIQIDSDVYGRWVMKMIAGDKQVKLDGITESDMSIFEFYTTNLIKDKNVKDCFSDDLARSFSRFYSSILSNSEYGIAKFQTAIYNSYGTMRVILYLHTTIEANLLSGAWQQIVIKPIHDTYLAVRERNRDNKIENELLHLWYNSMTPYSNRVTLCWAEYLMIFGKNVLNAINSKFEALRMRQGFTG